jgi:L-iditol 2-dehydrogenase
VKAKALIAIEKGKVALQEVELGEPGPTEVQIRVQTTIVSPGTERAIILSLENTQQSFPQDLGYSVAGFVEKTGAAVTRFKAGQRAACFTLHHCNIGNVSQDYCMPLDENVSFERAAFLSLGVISMQGVRKTRIELGESAMVLGLGPVGQLALQLCRLNGALPTIGVDKAASRLELAKELGADLVLNSSEAGWEKKARELSGGEGPHVVVESTGFPDPIATALDMTRKFGRISLLGSTRGQSLVNFYSTVHRKALTVVGAHIMGNPVQESRPGYWTWKDDAASFLQLLGRGRISVDPLITDRSPWQKYAEVYERLMSWDTGRMISVIDWT